MKGKVIILIGVVMISSGLMWYSGASGEMAAAEAAVHNELDKLRQEILVTETEGTENEVMPERKSDGIEYLGILSIPKFSLELPILDTWSTENGKIAPCRYAGSVIAGDLIFCAHNYDSHFGKLKELNIGDLIDFTDIEGKCYSYAVTECLILKGTDVDGIQDGEWDLTLFTCTAGGKNRVVIRCILLSRE